MSESVESENAENPWKRLGLSEAALELIEKAGFKAPTPIQAESIPISLEGHDLIAAAQTGTGKTASFVLPMVEKIVGKEGTLGLILAPTREIAQQTQATLDLFGAPRGVRSIVLIGGIDMKLDDAAIRSYPQIIVATPGRLCDHLDRGNIWLDFIQTVVLDEADRMLDMGFADQLARITEDLPKARQTLVFSATIPPSVKKLAQKILRDPREVTIGRGSSAAKTVEQKLIWLDEEAKMRELRRVMREEPGSIIVFTRSKDGASRLWRSLHSRGIYDATVIHSDRRQQDREKALAEFKEGKYRILIATDVAGRGIHVDEVAHVVNYDLPLEAEDYVHRIGRTGRIGASGKATSFATRRDRDLVSRIERLLGSRIPEETRSSDRPAHGHGHGHGERRHHSNGQAHANRQANGQANGHEAAVSTEAGAAPAESRGPAEPGADGARKKRRRRRGGRGRGPAPAPQGG